MFPTVYLRILAMSCILLFSTPAWSAWDESAIPPPGEPTVVEELTRARELVKGGKVEEALAVLRPLAAGQGDMNVLFALGLAAVEAAQAPGVSETKRDEHLDEAIGAFRTMLIERPDLVRVRLELARAFFLKGEDGLARRHFEQVLAGNPPGPVATNVRLFLIQIRARRRWSFNVGFALAPDSNIGSGSEERTIYIFDLPFRRDAEELTTSGVGVSLWGGAEYHYPLNDRMRLRAGGNLLRREYEGSAFDETYASAHLGPRILVDGRTQASVLGTASQRWAGTVKDFHALGGRVEAGRRLSRTVSVNGRVSWEDRHYRTRVSLDGDALDVSLGGSWVVAPTVRAELSAGYGRERPEAMRERHERYRAGAGVSVILPRGFTVGGGGEYRWTDYESGWFPHVPDGGAREDRTWSARASVYNRGITLYGFSPEVSVVHEVRKSNAQLYDYERTRGELRFVRQF